MSDAVLIELIRVSPLAVTAIASAFGVIVGLRNRSAIHDIHVTMNSRLDQLVTASKDSGRIAERADVAAKKVLESELPISPEHDTHNGRD